MMNILYIGIYGVHSMELIYYIMKLEYVAKPLEKASGNHSGYFTNGGELCGIVPRW